MSTNNIYRPNDEMYDAEEFQKLLNKNMDNYIENTASKMMQSFKDFIYDEIIKASRNGKNCITVHTGLLYQFDSSREFYVNECTRKGLKLESNMDRYVDISACKIIRSSDASVGGTDF